MTRLRFGIVLAAGLAAWSAEAGAETLYDDLGGRPGLTRITSDCIDLAMADKRIATVFDNSDIPKLKANLHDQLCMLTGGGCAYKGKEMSKSHAPLHLTNADFNALVEDLQTAMDRAKVPYRVQNRLLAILAPMQRDIVTR